MQRNYNANEVAETLQLLQQTAALTGDQSSINFVSDIAAQRTENARLFHIQNQAFISDLLVVAIYFSGLFLNPFEEKSALWGIFQLVVVLGLWGCSTAAFSDQLTVANHSRENSVTPDIEAYGKCFYCCSASD